MNQNVQNPLLKQVEAGIEKQVPTDIREAYDRIVVAGMKIMFDEKSHGNMQLVKDPQAKNDIVGSVSKGIAGLMYIMHEQSRGPNGGEPTMPLEPAVLASITLMTKSLDFAERGLGVRIDRQILADCTEATAEQVLRKFNISQEQVEEVVARTQAGEQLVPPKSGQPQPQPTRTRAPGLVGE